jgi:two-component system, NarL family, nitrate/nitrite response regulator NarL
MTASVILVDDHALILQGLRHLIEGRGFQVIGEYRDAGAAIEAIRRDRPDICVVDLKLLDGSGLTVLETAIAEQLPTKIVLLAAVFTDRDIHAAVEAGAYGILLKEWAADTLLDCLAAVAVGNHWLPGNLVGSAIGREGTRRRKAEELMSRLSPRQRETALLVLNGKSVKEIAHSLDLSEGTVKLHLHAVFQKLGVSTRAALLSLLDPLKDWLEPL